jgi:hypothetical protein
MKNILLILSILIIISLLIKLSFVQDIQSNQIDNRLNEPKVNLRDFQLEVVAKGGVVYAIELYDKDRIVSVMKDYSKLDSIILNDYMQN